MNDREALGPVTSWLWPVGPTAVCLGVIALALLLSQRLGRGPAWHVTIGVAAISGLVSVFQLLQYGSPASLWLAAAIAAALILHGLSVTRVALSHALHQEARGSLGGPWEQARHSALRPAIFTALRNATIAVAAGVLVVVMMQLVLSYQTSGHAERVLYWNRLIAQARDWLKEIVFLGPVKLGCLLAALIAVVAAMPALRVVRSYRRFATTATHLLLALTVTTSFTFFAGTHARGWQRDWVAQRSRELDGQIRELDKQNNEIVKLAAIEASLRDTSPTVRTHLGLFAKAISSKPYVDATWRQMAARWRDRNALAPVVERVEQMRARLEVVAGPAAPAAQVTAKAFDRLRNVRTAPEAIEFADLDVLKVQRSTAAAVRQEMRSAVSALLQQFTLGDTLAGQVAQGVLDGVRGTEVRFGRVVDATQARAAARSSASAAPRVSFDLVGTTSSRDLDGTMESAERAVELAIEAEVTRAAGDAELQRIRDLEIAAQRDRMKDDLGVPSAAGGPRHVHHPDAPAQPTRRPTRPGRSGGGRGGRFGLRRRDQDRPQPVRLTN